LLSIKSTGACFVIGKTSFKRPIYVISGQFQPICPYIIIKGNKKFPNKKSLKVNCKEFSYPSTYILQEKEQNHKKCSPHKICFPFSTQDFFPLKRNPRQLIFTGKKISRTP
jgi:hypothetical protein